MRALPLILLLGCTSEPSAPATPPEVGAKTPEATPPEVTKTPDAPAAALEVGAKAPEFSLVGSDGKTHSLSELRGKRAVVLAWYPKAFTGGCTRECKSLREGGEAIRSYEVAYYAVSTDTAEDNKKFAESLDADYPILADPTGDAARAFGVIGKDGKHAQRWTFYIDAEGVVRDIDREVKPDSAAQDIVKRLDTLGIPKTKT